jgi:hypothetical protein
VKQRFVLEFEEAPTLVFVSLDGKNDKLFIDGKEVKGWTGIDISCDYDDVTSYDLRKLAIRRKD